MEMLNNIFKPFYSALAFSKPRHDSYALLILSPGRKSLTYIHIVPEDPDIIEEGCCCPPTFPRCVSIQSRVPLGNLTVRITEGQEFEIVTHQLKELVKNAYNDDDTADPKDDGAGPPSDASNCINEALCRSERALRQGFSAIVASEETPRAAPQLYAVELVRLSKTKPGRIWDDTNPTSFPQ
ncbi:hypothetical protein FQN49_000600 [Arthroderma sp. PD_2]|nr:hypothetical protein FQN49_000600 [Arthroderma sp. PD_2]